MKRIAFSAALFGAVASVWAGPTGLITIPIADILGDREFAYTYGVSGTESRIDKRWHHAQGYAIGLFDILELGLENDFLGTTDLCVRLKLLEDPKNSRWAFSVGAKSWNQDAPSYHFVGRYDLPQFRVHAGLLQDDERRFFVGLDGPVFGDSTWMLEHTTGTGAMTWGGLSVPVKFVPGLSVMGAVGVPSERGGALQYQLNMTWGYKF